MLKRYALVFALAFPPCAGAAEALLMVAPLNQAMPLAAFDAGKLNGGIIKDLSDAIARRAGRRIQYVSVAGDQVASVLRQGKADGVCYVRPFWIDGDFYWSRPLIPDAELIASSLDAPVVRSLHDLRDRPVGTITGYRYPRVEQVVGLRFQRVDSATMEDNLRKMMDGGTRHTIIGQATLMYQLKVNQGLRLRSDLVFASFSAQCAFSKHSGLDFASINQAIDSLAADGSVGAILARYR